jgi:hypothetical protein
VEHLGEELEPLVGRPAVDSGETPLSRPAGIDLGPRHRGLRRRVIGACVAAPSSDSTYPVPSCSMYPMPVVPDVSRCPSCPMDPMPVVLDVSGAVGLDVSDEEAVGAQEQ